MNKPNQAKDFLRRLVENFVIQLLIGSVIISGIIYILKDSILSFLLYSRQTFIPLWITIIVVIAVIFLIFLITYSLKRRRHSPMIMSFRTRSGNEQEIPFSHNGLNWLAYIPRQSFKPDEYVWLKGPYCPKCAYELSWKRGIRESWHCERCNKNFKTFKKSVHGEREFVENMIFADIFRKEKFKVN